MPRNHKPTAVIAGSRVQSTTGGCGRLVIVFDDRSTMTLKTTGIAETISTGAKVKAARDNGDRCTLQFDDGSAVTLRVADPGAMWDAGCKLPTQVSDGRSRCFCGTTITIATTYDHALAHRAA